VTAPGLTKTATGQKKAPDPEAWRFLYAARTQQLKALRLFGSTTAKTLVETIDSTARIKNLLLAGVKRVALGTNVDVEIFTGR